MDYKVTFEPLRDAGAQYKRMSAQADQARGRLEQVALSQPDFGRIPWLQTRVWEAFVEHTAECKQAMADFTRTLQDVSEGIEATADAYEEIENSAAEAIDKFFEGVYA